MKRKCLILALMSVTLVSLLAGCRRMPLYSLYTRVFVELDIDIHSGVELDMVVDTDLNQELSEKENGYFPTLVEAVFYDTKSSAANLAVCLGPNGGEVNVPAGKHHLMIYSWGTKSTQTENLDDRYEARAFTSDITHLKGSQFRANLYSAKQQAKVQKSTEEYADDPIIYEPDHLYVAHKSVEIPSFTGLDTLHYIKAHASTILDVYSLEILGVSGCENIKEAEVFLTGQSKSYYIGRDEMDSSPATVYMTLEKDIANNRLYTVFGTFGKLPNRINNVYLDITTLGGERHRFVYDITHQFEDPDNVHHTLVIEAGVEIPADNEGGSGLSPEVNEWEDEIVDIPLG